MRISIIAIVAALAMATLSTAQAACSISDIQIKQATLVHGGSKGQFSWIVGELYNGCSAATGVRLHVTLRDKAGQVVFSSHPWPAGTNNIPPKSPYSFELPGDATEDRDRPAVVVQVEPENVMAW
jgi:hypothetical protein